VGIVVKVESLTEVVKSLNRDNAKLVEADRLPIDWTVSCYQMCLPLIHQAEIPENKQKRNGNYAEGGTAGVRPQARGPREQ